LAKEKGGEDEAIVIISGDPVEAGHKKARAYELDIIEPR